MNVASISVTKQFGFGLNVLGQISREKSVRIVQGTIRTGSRHLDEVFLKINGERFCLWRTVDHEGEVLECFVTKRGNKAAAKKLLIETMRKHGSPKIITTDELVSYGAVFREIGGVDRQLCGGQANNRCENSHLPFRRLERAMQNFKSCAMFQKYISYHAQIYNQFNHERHLESRQTYKKKCSAALIEWFNFCAA